MFDKGSITLDASPEARMLRDPFQHHSDQDIGNVKNKAGNSPITQEELLKQFD